MSMLDDFVQHSAGPSAPSRADGPSRTAPNVNGFGGSNIEAVEYEGFEVDEGREEDPESPMVQALETGFIPSSRLNSSLPALFSLSLVQYTPPSQILALVSANNLLFLGVHPLSIIIIDLNKPDELVTVDLPRPAPEKGSPNPSHSSPLISKLFVDPTARHLLITTTSNDTFYLPLSPGNSAVQSRRPRPLRLRHHVTAVGWSPLSGQYSDSPDLAISRNDAVTPPNTDVLLGTSTGQILSLPLPPQDDIFKTVSISMTKPVEKDLQVVYTLSDGVPVAGLAFGFWDREGGRKGKRAWVVVTTKDRVYEVQGNVSTTIAGGKGGGWAEEVFKPIRDGAPKFQELPGDPPNPELRLYLPSGLSGAMSLKRPTALAWITAPGLYTSPLPSSPSTDILTKPSLFPYPSFDSPPPFSRSAKAVTPGLPPMPISVAITEWHWLLLYPDRVIGVSRENETVVWEEPLPLAGDETAVGLAADPVSNTFWIFTDRSILEVLVRNEDRDVWRAKLDREDFAAALKYARTAPQRDIVLSRQGDSLFDQGKFIQAAQCYAKSSRSFEYVALRFVDAEERDALRIYLSDRLDLLDRRERTQRMMLATWLVEIYLSKCNELEDIVAAESATSDVESLSIERTMIEEDMRNFMTTYLNDLDPKVVYELILSHGRTDLYLFYADLKRDHGKILEHYMTEELWTEVIDVLNRQDSTELYYPCATVLMRHVPKEAVDAFLRRPSLSPRRLIPSLLHPSSATQSIRYLQHVIFNQHSTDSTIHNLLLTLLVSSSANDEAPLLRFLTTAPQDPITDRPYYDLDYALRLCKSHNKVQPCIHIYSQMGLYESSVDLALSKGDLELAKINADRPEDDDVLRRKLWLKIAKYVVQEQKDIKSAMKFLESTDLIKIEDIMPFFPDFVVIDDFKAEICGALEDYSARIEELRAEMDEATASAESIKKDIAGLANRFVTVEAGDKCWKCGLTLATRPFYVFPCQHFFHADCLISMARDFLPQSALRRLLRLQEQLVAAEPSGRSLLTASYTSAKPSKPSTPTPGTPRKREAPTSGNAATDLLLGVTGRNKLLAAGDKLRDLIVPDILTQAVSAVGSVGTAVVSVGGGGKKTRKDLTLSEEKVAEMRKELDELVAGVCPLCESAVLSLDKPFIAEGEDTRDWDV